MLRIYRFLHLSDPLTSVYKEWWHSLLISFSIASWGFAQPLYGYVINNNVLEAQGTKDIITLLCVYQVLPVVLLFLIDRGVARIGSGFGIFLKFWRVTQYLLVTLVVLRNLQLGGMIDFLDKVDSFIFIASSMIVILIFASSVVYFYRLFTSLFVYLSFASLVITILFIYDVGLFGGGSDSYAAVEDGDVKIVDQTLDPVFLIVFDALGGEVLFKDGQIDSNRFPNLAGLGLDGAVFNNATSNDMDTGFSFATMLTGQFTSTEEPTFTGLNSTRYSIFDSMQSAGYKSEFHSTVLDCPWSNVVCLDRALYSADSPHVAVSDFVEWFIPGELVEPIRTLILTTFPSTLSDIFLTLSPKHRGDIPSWNGFLDRISYEFTRGRFYLVHSFIAHRPYEWDRNGNHIRTHGVLFESQIDFDKSWSEYEEVVMFLDGQVGKFVSKLKNQGLYDDAVIIVTGDHGPRKLGLRHQNHAWDNVSQYPSDIDRMVPWVPLIIKGPDVPSDIYSTDYQHMDLLPTVLGLLDIPIPSNRDGLSVFTDSQQDRQKIFRAYPIIDGEVIYIYDADTDLWKRQK